MHVQTLFFKKISFNSGSFFNHHIGVFFELSVLKEVYIFSYLHINGKLLILKSKDKFSELVLLFGRVSYILSFRHGSIFLLCK